MVDKDVLDTLVLDWERERPDLDASAMLVVGRMLKLGKVLEKRASLAIQDYKINYTDLDVLATLRRSGKPYELAPKKLMQSVLISSGALTTLLNRLEKLELIYRSYDEIDTRIKRAGLTKKGIKVIDRAIEVRFEESKDAVKIFSKNEREKLQQLLKKMINHLEKGSKF